MLRKRHTEERVHRELLAAYTTAAVINYSMGRPEEGVSALDFMPSHHASTANKTEPTESQQEEESAFNLAVLEKAVQLKAEAAKKASDSHG